MVDCPVKESYRLLLKRVLYCISVETAIPTLLRGVVVSREETGRADGVEGTVGGPGFAAEENVGANGEVELAGVRHSKLGVFHRSGVSRFSSSLTGQPGSSGSSSSAVSSTAGSAALP